MSRAIETLTIPKLTLEQQEKLRALMDAMKFDLDKIIKYEMGLPVEKPEQNPCLICYEQTMVTIDQTYFQGPMGKVLIGGPQSPQYIVTEITRCCKNCGVNPAKIHSEILARLRN
jgi:hypothetical protein